MNQPAALNPLSHLPRNPLNSTNHLKATGGFTDPKRVIPESHKIYSDNPSPGASVISQDSCWDPFNGRKRASSYQDHKKKQKERGRLELHAFQFGGEGGSASSSESGGEYLRNLEEVKYHSRSGEEEEEEWESFGGGRSGDGQIAITLEYQKDRVYEHLRSPNYGV